MRCANLLRLSLLFGAISVGRRASAQDAPAKSGIRVSPALFTGGEKRSVGVRWEARVKKNWDVLQHGSVWQVGVCVPTRPADERSVELETVGGIATNAITNADPIQFSAHGSYWRSFYSPGCPNTNPDSASLGGHYRGSGSVRGFLRGEGRQSSREFDFASGVEVLYSRTSAKLKWGTLVPSFVIAATAVRPVQSALRDSLASGEAWFTRGDLQLAWHIPLPNAFRLDVNARGWRSAGLADTLIAAGLRDGTFLALDLTRPVRWHIWSIPIRELFLRRVEGEVPQDWRQRRSLMLGVQGGR